CSDLSRAADDVVFLSEGKVLANCPISELLSRYDVARFAVADGAEAIGLKACKEGFEGLVPRGSAPAGATVRQATLDEIILHLEYGRRTECARS
ncbi:MAG: hypothetical protein ACI4ST_05170, partial [Candidatus Gallimonas sp.]